MTSVPRRLWRWFAGTFAAVVILLAVAVGIFRLLLSLVPGYHDQIEHSASTLIGLPVEVGAIDARLHLAGPELVLSDASLRTPDESAVIGEVARVRVTLDLFALLRGKLRPRQVVLRGLDLTLERTGSGDFTIAGNQLGGDRSGGELPVTEIPSGVFELREASITYTDLARGWGPWHFTDARLRLAHDAHGTQVEGQTTLPEPFGGRIEFFTQWDGEGPGPLGRPRHLEAHADAVALVPVAALLPDGLPPVGDGRARVSVVASFRDGEPSDVSAEVALQSLQFGGDGAAQAPVRFDRLGGSLAWKRTPVGWQARIDDLVVERNGSGWPRAQFELESLSTAAGTVYTFRAPHAALHDLVPFAQWLPPGHALRQRLLAWQPRGTVRDLFARVTLDGDAVADYALKADFDDTGFGDGAAGSGLTGIDGLVRLDADGGHLTLDSHDVSVHAPDIFPQSVELKRLRGIVAWRRSDDGWSVISDHLELVAPDLTALLSLTLNLPSDGEPQIDARAEFKPADLVAVPGYLPAGRMHPDLVRWLSKAFYAGTVTSARATLRGPLLTFPYTHDEGRFHVEAEVEGAEVRFAPGWPHAEDVTGRMQLDNLELTVETTAGTLAGIPVQQTRTHIADVMHEAILVHEATTAAPVPDLVRFIHETPIQTRANLPEEGITTTGHGDVDVKLIVPLKKTEKQDFEVTGGLTVRDASLRIFELPHMLEQIDGRLNFDLHGVSATGVAASLLGAPVQLHVSRVQSDTGRMINVIDLEGSGASRMYLAEIDEGLASLARGPLAWRATIRLPGATYNEPLSAVWQTDLDGTQLLLPAPLSKPAEGQLPLAVEVVWPAAGLMELSVECGTLATGTGLFSRAEKGDEWKFERGAVHLGGSEALLPPSTGLDVEGQVDVLDADAWMALGRNDKGGEPAGPALRDFLASLQVSAKQLVLFGQELGESTFGLNRSHSEWLVQVESERLAGSIFVPFAPSNEEPVIARLDRLFIAEHDDDEEVSERDPRSIPGMRVAVRDFMLGERRFGSLEADIRRTDNGVRLAHLQTNSPSFTVQGSGRWFMTEAGQRSEMSLTLESNDLMNTLQSLGYGAHIAGRSGRFVADVNWPGGPNAHFLDQISGNVSVSMLDGRLVSLEPGAGKMFGLLSVGALPRRLTLDFRDVFDKGLAFDTVNGDFSLDTGNAYTSNLVLEGPAADVGIVGRTGLAARDYDQTAIVRGKVGSTLPVAGGLAAGPAVGAALFLFSEIFKQPLMDITRAHYRVTGSWEEPVVERIAIVEPENADATEADANSG